MQTAMGSMHMMVDATMPLPKVQPMDQPLVLAMSLDAASTSTARPPSLQKTAFILVLRSTTSKLIPLSILASACVLLVNISQSTLAPKHFNLTSSNT